MFTVYLVRCLPNQKVYIGVTSWTCEKRWQNHVYASKHRNYKFYNAIQKYGVANFRIEPIQYCGTKEEAFRSEVKNIKAYQSCLDEFGYNSRSGGDKGGALAEETKKKIAASQLAFFSNPKNRENLSIKMLGVHKGRKHSEETRRKMRESAKVRPLTPFSAEARKRMSEGAFRRHAKLREMAA